ncbi:putative triacylglycerol lipase [Helianthus annuus]|nr:putative triacylglycerol lipase [Helianthus annuus]
MSNSLIFPITYVLILFCSSALANQPRFSSNETTAVVASTAAASNADGICQSIVVPRGYPCEEHKVRTKDGFVLSLQRIPLGRAGGKRGSRVPVLLQHGLLMVSELDSCVNV